MKFLKNKICVYLKENSINSRFILLCSLLISSFLPRMYLPFIIVPIIGLFSFIHFRKNLYGKVFVCFLIALFVLSLISWLYNFYIYHTDNDIDFLGLMFWWLTNLFPFLILILVATLSQNIDISKLISFYRYILVIEFLIIVFKATRGNIFYGDYATGTCLDAHAMAIHFLIGIIVTLSDIFTNKERELGINFLLLIIFYIGLIMTSFKTNIIFLFMILILFFFYKLIRKIIVYKRFRNYTLTYANNYYNISYR